MGTLNEILHCHALIKFSPVSSSAPVPAPPLTHPMLLIIRDVRTAMWSCPHAEGAAAAAAAETRWLCAEEEQRRRGGAELRQCRGAAGGKPSVPLLPCDTDQRMQWQNAAVAAFTC